MSISLRIKELVDEKKISISAFEKEIKVGNAVIVSIIKRNSNVSGETLSKILKTYPIINPEWLITGDGSMYREVENKAISATAAISFKYPLVPIDAMAGDGKGEFNISNTDIDWLNIEPFKVINPDFLIKVNGSSMHPKYYAGDLLACKYKTLGLFFEWGKPYVLDTKEGAILKRVFQSEIDGCIKCVSDNAQYPPFDVKLKDINRIAIVVGSVRFE
jgi:repressor LexA